MKIKVANIIEDGKLAGPQTRMALVASNLNYLVKTTIIMPNNASEAFKKKCELLEVEYINLPISHITRDKKEAIRYILFSGYEILSIMTCLKQNKFDLIHVSGGCWQFKGAIAGILSRRKVVWHLNDTEMVWFIRKLFGIISKIADGYIFASYRTREYYKKLIPKGKHEFIIPAPVDTRKFDPKKNYNGDEELIKILQNKIVIGTIANINPIKGIEVLIKTAERINKIYDNVHFIVVGPVYSSQNGYFQYLKNLCNKSSKIKINFVGERLDVRPILKRFDIYVCSSLAESSPISVWEAMSMEKPVVSTNVGDVPIYIKDHYNGFIVDINDLDALSDRLKILINDPKIRQLFGKRSREIIIQKLDIKKCVDLHINAYKAILEIKNGKISRTL